jgi:hypothetical protein
MTPVRLVIAGAVIAAALPGASPAASDSTATQRVVAWARPAPAWADGGPAFAGDQILWAGDSNPYPAGDGAVAWWVADDVYSGAGGKAAPVLGGAMTGWNLDMHDFVAAPGRVAFVREADGDPRGDGGPLGTAPYFGSIPGAHAQRLSACDQPAEAASVALTPTILVWSGCTPATSPDEDGPVRVEDFADYQSLQVADRGIDVHAAGDIAAWRQDGGIVVYDAAARKELYRVAVSAFAHGVDEFAVQADGKLATIANPSSAPGASSSQGWIGWVAPGGQPQEFAVPMSFDSIRMANDQIVVKADDPLAQHQGVLGSNELILFDLAGAGRTLAQFQDASEDFDFNGTDVTWASTECGRLVINRRAVTAPGTDTNPKASCPMTMFGAAARQTRRGMIALQLFCPSPDLRPSQAQCRGTVRVMTADGRLAGSEPFDLHASDADAAGVSVRLASHLRETARLRVVITSVMRGVRTRSGPFQILVRPHK